MVDSKSDCPPKARVFIVGKKKTCLKSSKRSDNNKDNFWKLFRFSNNVSDVGLVHFEQIAHIVLVSIILTL